MEQPIEQLNKDKEQKDKKGIKLPKFNPKRFFVIFGVIILIILCCGMSSYLTISLLKSQGYLSSESTQVYNVSNDTNVVNIVNQVSKSVVSISTKTASLGWFGRVIVSEGAGTGIVINNNGYILTNNHVVSDIDEITVTTYDNKEYSAKVIITSESKDLAIIRVNTKNKLIEVKIGNSDSIKVGEEVLAVGNVLGRYKNSVTKGIVSGLGRPIVAGDSLYGDLRELEDLIQTDTAINSGNSGGPLVNMKGEVIGINTAIDGQAQNIGFSVPINHAKTLLKNIK